MASVTSLAPDEEAALDFTTLGVQAVAAATAVGVLWFAARKDSRDARTEFQKSIETLMAPRLEILDGKIDTKLEALDGKIDSIREGGSNE